MAGINLGPAFNADLIALVGWNPDTVDATTLDVAYVNPGGRTTVRVTATTDVDSAALQTLICQHGAPKDSSTTS
jgi:hypothetical protein